MFNVYGNDIVLEHVKIGELKGGWPGLRDRAVSYLEGMIDDYVSEEDHCQQIEEASDKAYQEGQIDKELELRPLVEQELKAAYQRGYDAAKRDLWVKK